jgi:hypothetical protein
MVEQNKHDVNKTGESRRRFIARNFLGAGAIATTALMARVHRAHALPFPIPNPTPGQCFMKGTLIDLADSAKKVEDVVAGDRVPTLFGGLQPIKWVGRYKYRKTDCSKPWAKDVLPVRIARSAIAPNIPNADLFVTRGHALFLDGVLVPAGSLVNGATITLDPAVEYDELEFFHIKLERHDVISAQAALVETLQNVDENAVNFAEYYREFGMPTEDEAACAPLMSYNGGISEIKSRVRSAISPLIDRRLPIDVIRDRLEARGLALSRPNIIDLSPTTA